MKSDVLSVVEVGSMKSDGSTSLTNRRKRKVKNEKRCAEVVEV